LLCFNIPVVQFRGSYEKNVFQGSVGSVYHIPQVILVEAIEQPLDPRCVGARYMSSSHNCDTLRLDTVSHTKGCCFDRIGWTMSLRHQKSDASVRLQFTLYRLE
jgi:hypothetical protein